MFWFLLIALVVVVAAVALAVVGGGEKGALAPPVPDRLVDPLPEERPVGRADVEALRLPMAVRGYRMSEVDDALARLGAELAERDARIAELESALAGAEASAVGGGLLPAYDTGRPTPYDTRQDSPQPPYDTGETSQYRPQDRVETSPFHTTGEPHRPEDTTPTGPGADHPQDPDAPHGPEEPRR